MNHYRAATSWPSDDALDKAARRLLNGRLVAFPTETVYGLGADAENARAVGRVFDLKHRPRKHPLIVHLAPGADPGYWSSLVSPQAKLLMDVFWPGPLTLILRRADHIPAAVSGGQDTIGLRCPSHPVAQALLRRFAALKPSGQGGVAAPSANRFGHVSPTTAAHVYDEFPEVAGGVRLMVLDGGASVVGIESTILDVSDPAAAPVLLRPGHIGREQLEAVLGVPIAGPQAGSPQVSGSLKAHYATRTPLELVDTADLPARIAALSPAAKAGARYILLGFEPGAELIDSHIAFAGSPTKPLAYARALYGLLRDLDEAKHDGILIEHPPRTPEWQGVNDRLSRAAAAFTGGIPAAPRC